MERELRKLTNQYGGSIPFSKVKSMMNKSHNKPPKKSPKKVKKKTTKKLCQPSRSPRKLKDGVILRGKDNKLWKTKKHKWIRIRGN